MLNPLESITLQLSFSSSIIFYFFLYNHLFSKIQLTFDNTKLITCSEDGTICIWDVENPTENITDNMNMTTNSKFVDEVLISTKHLASCASRIAKLNTQSKLLSKEIVYGSLEYDRFQKKQDVIDYYNRLFLRLHKHREVRFCSN